MKNYNLLTENWIPVRNKNQYKKISLKSLLCFDQDLEISLDRDDMELAALQLTICLVQTIFIPNNKEDLIKRYEKAMSESDYEKGIKSTVFVHNDKKISFDEIFDLIHDEYPFMQTASVQPGNSKTKWSSVQKLLVGLPEGTSTTSKAFFNTSKDVERLPLNLAAIALFQQATNGHSLGGSFYACGLKGNMPITTIIKEKNLRQTIWSNVLHKKFLENRGLIEKVENNEPTKNNKPTWIVPPSFDKSKPTYMHKIGLLRGLFWQQAKVKLEIKDGYVTGFIKDKGYTISGSKKEKKPDCWTLHPHTPTNLHADTGKFRPLTVKKDFPIWEQMLKFLYQDPVEKKEGSERALVVSSYESGIGYGKGINLAVGGYVKGNAPEKLVGRKHEIYSLAAGWEEDKAKDVVKSLVYIGLYTQKSLNNAIYAFGKNFNAEKSNLIKNQLKPKAKLIYFNNSERIIHNFLKLLDDTTFETSIEDCKDEFANLARQVFKQVLLPYTHDPKFFKAFTKGECILNKKLAQLKKQESK